MNNKKVMIFLIVVIVGLVAYATMSGNGARKELKNLSKELELTTANLVRVTTKYDSLSTEYNKVYTQFSMARNQLDSTRIQINKMMSENISNVNDIRDRLNGIGASIDTTKLAMSDSLILLQ